MSAIFEIYGTRGNIAVFADRLTSLISPRVEIVPTLRPVLRYLRQFLEKIAMNIRYHAGIAPGREGS
jgi:hypothetical protein